MTGVFYHSVIIRLRHLHLLYELKNSGSYTRDITVMTISFINKLRKMIYCRACIRGTHYNKVTLG